MEMVLLALIGIVLGVSAVIPGLSMGTMAVTFNVYDRLIGIITPNVKKILAAWKFWVSLLIGICAGIFLFSKLVSFLFENYEVPTYWFFIGLIAGSVPLIYGKIKLENSALPKASSVICALIALAVMIVFALVNPEKSAAVYTELTLKLFLLITLGGVLASLAMIIPGLSGSFMMLVIGLYPTIIRAISDLNILLLCPMALGVLIGLFGGAAGIRFLLEKAPKAAYGAVFGLVLGSIIVLFKIPAAGSANFVPVIIFSMLAFAGGFAASFFAGRKS